MGVNTSVMLKEWMYVSRYLSDVERVAVWESIPQ